MRSSPSPSPQKLTGRGGRSPPRQRSVQPKVPASRSSRTVSPSKGAPSGGHARSSVPSQTVSSSRRASPRSGVSRQYSAPSGASPPPPPPPPPPPVPTRFPRARQKIVAVSALLILGCQADIKHFTSDDETDTLGCTNANGQLCQVFECVAQTPSCVGVS